MSDDTIFLMDPSVLKCLQMISDDPKYMYIMFDDPKYFLDNVW